MSSIIAPHEARAMFAKASRLKSNEWLKLWTIRENHAEALMRHQANHIFRPSQFYVSYADWKRYIADAGMTHEMPANTEERNKGLNGSGELALALWCLRFAAKHGEVPDFTSGPSMRLLSFKGQLSMASTSQEMHRVCYRMLGTDQEALPFISKGSWTRVKDELRSAANAPA